jgi:hypothetical protein
MPVLTKINTNVIADNAVTAAKLPAGAVDADIGVGSVTASHIAANAVGSSELADDAVLPANIAYLGDGTGKLSGTITGQQLRLGSAFTLTDTLTVNGDLTLSKLRADGTGQSLTQDSSANRTITNGAAGGTIRMGHVTEKTSIGAFTGVLNSSVTGQKLAKAWVNFDGTTNTGGLCTIRDSFNVSSVTDNGAGDYYLNYANNLANDDYVVSFGARATSGGGNAFARLSNVMSTSQTRFLVKDLSGNSIDGETVTATVFGD